MNIKEWPCWAKVGVAVMLAVFVLNWPASGTEWAAWVQAFGSIGAIVAAIYVMSGQAKTQRDLKLIDKKETLASAVRLIEESSRYIIYYVNEPELKGDAMSGVTEPFDVWLDVFARLDITSPALHEIATYVTNIRLQVVTMRSILLAIEHKRTTFDEQKKMINVSCNSIKKNANLCSRVLADQQ